MNEPSRFFMPQAASTVAGEVDRLYYFIHWVSVFFFVLIVGLMVYFVVRYRRRAPDETTPDIAHNTPLEVLWTLVPLAILLVIFFWGFSLYMNMRVAPGNALNIYVTAQRWAYGFAYPNGSTSMGELVVPVNEPVKLTMSSKDLLHGFFIPDFRVKQDILPNRYTSLWFQATRTGTFDLYCTQYCGTGHSNMRGTIKVVTAEEYEKFLKTGGIDPSKMSLKDYGAALYRAKACVTCHSVDGSLKTGPTWKSLFGKQQQLSDGSTITVDENFIREHVMTPGKKVVAGFPNVMPSYKGQLTDKEMNAIIEYIKSLK
jgi:cytochrome c oxidase subunit II